jgi:hypothetical protein
MQQQQQQTSVSDRATSLDFLQQPSKEESSNDQIVSDILAEINTETNSNTASYNRNDPQTQLPLTPQTDEHVSELHDQANHVNNIETTLSEEPLPELNEEETDLKRSDIQQQTTVPEEATLSVKKTFDIITVVKDVLLFMIVYILFALPDVQQLFQKLPFFKGASGNLNLLGTVGCALLGGLLFTGVKFYV